MVFVLSCEKIDLATKSVVSKKKRTVVENITSIILGVIFRVGAIAF